MVLPKTLQLELVLKPFSFPYIVCTNIGIAKIFMKLNAWLRSAAVWIWVRDSCIRGNDGYAKTGLLLQLHVSGIQRI